MQWACFGLRWYDKICIKRLKIYSASSAKHYYTMLILSIYRPTANEQLYEVQQGFIAAELVLTLSFLLQGALASVTYKNVHSKPQISNISLTEVPVVVPEVKMNHFLQCTDVFHMLAVKSYSGALWDERGHH